MTVCQSLCCHHVHIVVVSALLGTQLRDSAIVQQHPELSHQPRMNES